VDDDQVHVVPLKEGGNKFFGHRGRIGKANHGEGEVSIHGDRDRGGRMGRQRGQEDEGGWWDVYRPAMKVGTVSNQASSLGMVVVSGRDEPAIQRFIAMFSCMLGLLSILCTGMY